MFYIDLFTKYKNSEANATFCFLGWADAIASLIISVGNGRHIHNRNIVEIVNI